MRVTDTLAWLNPPFKFPGSDTTELLIAAIESLKKTLSDLSECGSKNGINLNTITESIQESVIQAAKKVHPDVHLKSDPCGEHLVQVESKLEADTPDMHGEQRVSPLPVNDTNLNSSEPWTYL